MWYSRSPPSPIASASDSQCPDGRRVTFSTLLLSHATPPWHSPIARRHLARVTPPILSSFPGEFFTTLPSPWHLAWHSVAPLVVPIVPALWTVAIPFSSSPLRTPTPAIPDVAFSFLFPLFDVGIGGIPRPLA